MALGIRVRTLPYSVILMDTRLNTGSVPASAQSTDDGGCAVGKLGDAL